MTTTTISVGASDSASFLSIHSSLDDECYTVAPEDQQHEGKQETACLIVEVVVGHSPLT